LSLSKRLNNVRRGKCTSRAQVIQGRELQVVARHATNKDGLDKRGSAVCAVRKRECNAITRTDEVPGSVIQGAASVSDAWECRRNTTAVDVVQVCCATASVAGLAGAAELW
jgi:hypothetical protein